MRQDTEKWTAVHPDTYSAPEIQQLADKSRQKVVEVFLLELLFSTFLFLPRDRFHFFHQFNFIFKYFLVRILYLIAHWSIFLLELSEYYYKCSNGFVPTYVVTRKSYYFLLQKGMPF